MDWAMAAKLGFGANAQTPEGHDILLRLAEQSDVVIENKLSALVIEGFPFVTRRAPREHARLREIAGIAKRSFFLVAGGDPLISLATEQPTEPAATSKVAAASTGGAGHSGHR